MDDKPANVTGTGEEEEETEGAEPAAQSWTVPDEVRQVNQPPVQLQRPSLVYW